jgi:hypothetical protein
MASGRFPQGNPRDIQPEQEGVQMRKTFALAVPLALAVVTSAASAAGSAHFIRHATSATLNSSSLTVSFKEAGLSSGSVETVVLSAVATTTYECVNGGGRNPSASNKTSTTTNLTTSGTFTADRNGNIVGSETLNPPSASDVGFACPPGQRTTFVGVTYQDVSITDTTSGASTDFPGTFSYTDPSAP